jgi:hypothetical protein
MLDRSWHYSFGILLLVRHLLAYSSACLLDTNILPSSPLKGIQRYVTYFQQSDIDMYLKSICQYNPDLEIRICEH